MFAPRVEILSELKRSLPAFAATALLLGAIGCKQTAPARSHPVNTIKPEAQYPSRPDVAPPSFKLFHQTNDSFTLVTIPNATDDQISAIIYELRDAAHARTFEKLGISQKLVDARDPMVWFHIYRGTKCASEKYTSGKLPCGASYHAAGDYTFGGGADHAWDDGVLIHDEDHQTELWDPHAPYTPVHGT